MQVNLEKWYKDTSKSLRKSGAEGYYTFFINFLKISFILLTKGGKKREMEREREQTLLILWFILSYLPQLGMGQAGAGSQKPTGAPVSGGGGGHVLSPRARWSRPKA